MYSVVCDRCGKPFIDEFNGIGAWLDEGTAKEQAMESEWAEIGDFMGGTVENKGTTLVIHTLEGDMEASIGDYIIKGVNGEFYPCKPDIFAKTYEEVTE